MKKALIILLSLIILLVLIGLAVPIFFKDEIKAKINDELNAMLNATVVFDTDNFHLSIFQNFPNITAGMESFGIINNAPFEGEILFAVERLDVEVDLQQILFGDKLSLRGIYLNHPEINLLVNESGEANWDIYIDSGEEAPEEVVDESAEEVSFGIDHWQITNGHFVYDDASIPFRMEFIGMNHTGSGDFTLSVFDMNTFTQIDTALVVFDGVHYLKNQSLTLDAILGMDLDAFKFTFKENSIAVNEFAMDFDGWFAMPEEGFDMDITYKASNNSFKSLLSLIPAVYMEGFEDLSTSGSLSFDGFVKGKYTESSMPAFGVNLAVADGMMQYPDLPAAIRNINVDMLIENEDGDPYNTLIDIRNFHLDFGENPFDGNLRIENLYTYAVQANVNGKLNLGELSQMFPMEGTELRGILEMKAIANGAYDSIAETIPTLDLFFKLTDGYVSAPDVPFPLEEIQIDVSIKNSTGKINDTEIRMDKFSALMAGETLTSSMVISNLDNAQWDVSFSGKVDLEKMMPAVQKLYPMPGVSLVGVIEADGRTQGKMSDLDAERYERMPTSGSLNVSNFKYVDDELLPQGFGISQASMLLTPSYISLTNFDGNIGRSDMKLSGRITNYMDYMFNEGIVKGQLNYQASVLDLNEWMTEEDEEETLEEEETDLEVIPIPKDIDFVFTSRIGKILYEDKTLENAKGKITVRGGEVILDDFRFDMLGGTIAMNGKYDTHDVEHPYFDYVLDIKNLSINDSYSTFNTVQNMAPIAKNISGNYSTQFNIKGNLDNTMMPDYATITGGGLIEILQATLKGSKIMTGVNALTNQSNSDAVSLSNILMSGEIKDGRFHVKPFDVKIGKYQSNVSGSNGLDGSLDYILKMDIPAGELGQQVNQAISNLIGENNTSSTLKLTIGIQGTYDDPQPKLLAAGTGENMKEAVAAEVKEEVINVIQDKVGDQIDVAKVADTEALKEEAKKEVDTVKAEINEIAKSQTDSLKQGLITGDTAKVEKAIKDAQNKVKDLFKKKKKKN